MNNRELIIGVYPGLGDNLFFSHIPRLAKESGMYDKVFISFLIEPRNSGTKELIWEQNPYVDGYKDLFGVSPWTLSLPLDLREMNLLDFIMLGYGLDDGKRFHEPELYYKPKFKEEYNKVIYDPNWISNVGDLNSDIIMHYFNSNNIKLDAVMKKLSDKALFNYDDNNIEVLETKSLEDFCDLIYSAKELYCLTTGTATLAAALNKPSVVLYGKNIGAGHELAKLNDNVGSLYHHSRMHKYVLIVDSKIRVLEVNFLNIKLRFHKKTLDKIVWFIPIKKLRDSFRNKFKIESSIKF